jgi:hypothetical protein
MHPDYKILCSLYVKNTREIGGNIFYLKEMELKY